MNIEIKMDGSNGSFNMTNPSEDLIGELTWRMAENNTMIIDHTVVQPEYNGQGLAKKLVLAAYEYATTNDMKIDPRCSYARGFFEKHPEYNAILRGDVEKITS